MDKQEFRKHQFSMKSILLFRCNKNMNKANIVLKMFTKHVYWHFLYKTTFSNILPHIVVFRYSTIFSNHVYNFIILFEI